MIERIRALKRSIFHRINRNLAVSIISAIVVMVALSWSVRAWLAPAVSRAPASANPAQMSPPGQSNQGKRTPAPSSIQVEPITLKPDGFEPKEVRRPATPFVLAVNNRSRLMDVSFGLFREDQHKVQEIKGSKGQIRLMKMIDLPPGNYLLKEVNHPEWMCHIVLSR